MDMKSKSWVAYEGHRCNTILPCDCDIPGIGSSKRLTVTKTVLYSMAVPLHPTCDQL